jgi:nucleosome binding factor SPN SPT16 subunit
MRMRKLGRTCQQHRLAITSTKINLGYIGRQVKRTRLMTSLRTPPPPKKKRKAMIGALPVPDDDDSSGDDEEEEEEEEEEEAEEGGGNIYEDEDDRAKDYDDDLMSGLSGPSLTSGSEYQPSP